MTSTATQRIAIEAVRPDGRARHEDTVAVEEPLEIRVARAGEPGPGHAVSVTMRTPGHDVELALGFLYGEGLIHDMGDVLVARHCGAGGNVVRVDLEPDIEPALARLARNFYTSSSCGVCGKASIEAVTQSVPLRPVTRRWTLDEAILCGLPAKLRAAQQVFASTGGLHAVGRFDRGGRLQGVFEDVGRHNAMDKLVGAGLMAGSLPMAESIVLLSGRASFELVQKAMVAGVPVLAAIGAPSSLAIELAREAAMTLIAFLRGDSFNVYTHGERLVSAAVSS